MTSTVAGIAAGAWNVLGGRSARAAAASDSEIKVAGYGYDRVRAIVDGTVGLPGSLVAFDFQDIYTVNRSAFG